MIKSLHLENLTVFPQADLEIGKNLNIVIGENGLGKSHLLKVLYTVVSVSATAEKESGSPTPTKSFLQGAMARKLREVFKPDTLGRLARRKSGRTKCVVSCAFDTPAWDLAFSFNNASKAEVAIDLLPTAWVDKLPVFLPTRELMSIYPGFVSLYEINRLPIEETWRDTCILLGAPLAKGAREKKIEKLIEPLEAAMGGSIELDGERFYLKSSQGRIEMNLVAEGLRKLAMLARLIATGALVDEGTLFWDEPEANLNPKLIRGVAHTILELCAQGVQIFLATHSLFLLRELEMLLADRTRAVEARFFGLQRSDEGVSVQQGPAMEDMGPIAVLDEELEQSDRFLAQGD